MKSTQISINRRMDALYCVHASTKENQVRLDAATGMSLIENTTGNHLHIRFQNRKANRWC